uniref:C2H2-type domain-containing protein n=1 Tax=Monopterus albus TaxID=43700 RepID=A0A3Q3IHJ5_MONAL
MKRSQATPQPVICEMCGTYFETRRGLSSHARLHLRQLGVPLSESSGAPIELLYQLIQEKDGSLQHFKADSSAPGPTALKNTTQQESSTPSVPEDKSASYKAGVGILTTPQKTDHQGSPARLKESAGTLLPSSPSAVRCTEGGSSSTLEHQTTTKPLWAPLETDAPITLASDTNDEVYVCQLCGCWYETRKGLSSHARAHLRQIGISESEIKGNPVDFLYQVMEEEEDHKPTDSEQQESLTSNSPSRPSSKRVSDLSSPPASPSNKRPKTSELHTCILCGEEFENRKGLASHCRSHLRQIGVIDLLGKSSAVETVEELVSSGVLEAMHPPKTNSTVNSSAAPSLSAPSLHTPSNKAPKAKKGFRLAVDPLLKKPKSEPMEMEVSVQQKASSTNSSSPTPKSPTAVATPKRLSAGKLGNVQSPPTVLCDFCGQLFDTRKALSCHVRAHLRQLGLAWSIRTSPIDLLKEVMMHGGQIRKESLASGKATWTPQGSRRSRDNTSCELCGFEFENRKALASHARAHLRQLGLIEWKADGASSPIELLSELIRKDPAKVAAITQRYRVGDLYIKKVVCAVESSQRSALSPTLSIDSDFVSGSSLKPEHKVSKVDLGVTATSSRQSHGHTRAAAARSDLGVRSPRGERLKSLEDGKEHQDSQQPSHTGSIPALLPKPPLTPLVKLVGKIYSLKCRFCEEVFHGPLSVQEKWITHLQKHILSLGYKGKASPPAAPVTAPALVHPVAV